MRVLQYAVRSHSVTVHSSGQWEHTGKWFVFHHSKGWLIQTCPNVCVGFKSNRGMSVEGNHRERKRQLESERRMRLNDT